MTKKEHNSRIKKCVKSIKKYGYEGPYDVVRFYFPKEKDYALAREELLWHHPEVFL